MANPEDVVEENLSGPKRVVVDGNIVEQYDLDNQIKAAEFLEKQKSKAAGGLGIQRFKIRPGGSL